MVRLAGSLWGAPAPSFDREDGTGRGFEGSRHANASNGMEVPEEGRCRRSYRLTERW